MILLIKYKVKWDLQFPEVDLLWCLSKMYINKISIFLLKIQQIYTEINNSVYRKIYQDNLQIKIYKIVIKIVIVVVEPLHHQTMINVQVEINLHLQLYREYRPLTMKTKHTNHIRVLQNQAAN